MSKNHTDEPPPRSQIRNLNNIGTGQALPGIGAKIKIKVIHNLLPNQPIIVLSLVDISNLYNNWHKCMIYAANFATLSIKITRSFCKNVNSI